MAVSWVGSRLDPGIAVCFVSWHGGRTGLNVLKTEAMSFSQLKIEEEKGNVPGCFGKIKSSPLHHDR